MIELVFGAVALAALVLSADVVVDKCVDLARRFGISELFIGLTVLSIGTSFPEITSHVVGSLRIVAEPSLRPVVSSIVLGNNIGSNLVQITLITGLVGIIGTLMADKKFLRRDYFLMLASIAALFLFSLDGEISQLEGFVMFAAYMAYLAFLGMTERVERKQKVKDGAKFEKIHRQVVVDVAWIVGGLAVLLVSADQLISSATWAVETFGISGSLIGIFIMGAASAMPELTTSVKAVMKKSAGISIGTLVGSNITNPLMGIGLGAMITPYSVEPTILWFDLPFWFFASVVPLVLFWRRKEMSKRGAALLIGLYALFVVLRLLV